MLAGFEVGASEAAAAGRPIVVRALLTAMRTAARSREIAELAVAFRDAGVCGFDVAGAEAGYPPTQHLDAFQLVQRENFHATLHAGEAFGLPSIWEALQWCNAERLGHGVRIVDDIDVADDGSVTLGRLAAYVRDRRVPLEMCPTSNVHTGAVPSLAEHPIELLRRLRFRVTLNTDNRLMSDVTMTSEMATLCDDVRVGLRGPRVAHAQRDEERVLPVRPAPRAHQLGHQAPLRRAHRRDGGDELTDRAPRQPAARPAAGGSGAGGGDVGHAALEQRVAARARRGEAVEPDGRGRRPPRRP